jgi:hypothetical protein
VLDLFHFIDWVLNLPETLKREFWQELRTFEEERRMPYITSVEEIGFERGEKSLIVRQLSRRLRLKALPEVQRTQVESLPLAQLEVLGEALLDFQTLSDLEQWLTINPC